MFYIDRTYSIGPRVFFLCEDEYRISNNERIEHNICWKLPTNLGYSVIIIPEIKQPKLGFRFQSGYFPVKNGLALTIRTIFMFTCLLLICVIVSLSDNPVCYVYQCINFVTYV